MTALKLRSYQSEAVDAVYADWEAGITPGAVVLPTGSGKTVIFSAITARWFDQVGGDYAGRVLILVDRNELVEQTARTIVALVPGVTVGVVKAGRDETHAQVIIASVQTLRRPERMARLAGVRMIIIDECDLALAPGYQDILSYYGALQDTAQPERIPCVGVTATLERGDGQGFGEMFAKISYTRDILWMIRHGYLSDVRGLTPANIGIDLSRVRKSRVTRDFDEHDLGEAMGQDTVTLAIADAYLEHALNAAGVPRPGVHFAPTVASAEAQCAAYNRAGVPAEVVTGETPLDVRAAIYHRFRTGYTRVLVNCMVLTRGWDAPHAEVAVMGRPTQSPSLYIQCVGRVLRLWPGKGKALVLDVVGAAKTHKLASLIDMSTATPKADESLLEADEREMKESSLAEMGVGFGRKVRGAQLEDGGELTEVNLFAQSSSAWLQTRKGVWFVNTKAKTWFLWEDAASGAFGVAFYLNAEYSGRPYLIPGEQGLDMTLALAIAEDHAMNADPSIASRSSSWRKNKQISDAQRSMLAKWRVDYDEATITRAQASDLISVAVASSRIDKYIR